MMTNRQLEKKVRQDATKIKKDLGTLLEDGSAQVNGFGDNVARTTNKVKGDVSQMSEDIGQLSNKAKSSAINKVNDAKKDVGQRLSNYNDMVQKVADKAPAELGKKARRYPWVTITIALVLGFIIGSTLYRPAHVSPMSYPDNRKTMGDQ